MPETIDTSEWVPEILPTRHRMEKGDVEIVRTDRGGMSIRARNFSDPLLYYARNGFIEPEELRAGRKCQGLWFMSGMRSQYAISKYTDVHGGSGEYLSLEEIQQAYRLATEAIKGVREKQVCFLVCCMGEKAGRTGRTGNLRYLRGGLKDLVKYFGFDK